MPCTSPSSRYLRHTPEHTALHLVVREHLETFLGTVREEREKPLPRYVEEELRRYLRCGILAHGFLRVACSKCHDEILVAFSCKCRGACPSCSARRMCGTAAHLVDHVLPDTAMRQWVLTVPSPVRRILALRPDALTACNRIFVGEIRRLQKSIGGVADAETGSVTFVQRFDSTLGCFVHFHVVAPDGVFTRRDDGNAVFHHARAPSQAEIAGVARRVGARMARWLRRRKLLDERPIEERSNEAPELSPMEACMQMSLFGGTFVRLGGRTDDDPEGEERFGGNKRNSPWSAEADGFDVHAGVCIRAGDRVGLERLCRYGARPAFSLERLSVLPDGRVAYLLRKPRKNGATHLVMTPMQCLARIASLIPPPRFPLVRFAGVLAPASTWRADVTALRGVGHPTPGETRTPKPKPKRKSKSANKNDEATPSSTPRTSLGAGIVPLASPRIDWASLLRRAYLEDVLACPCGGRRRIIADVTERDVVVEILTHLGLSADHPPIARARDPTFDAT